ncbi:MAG: ABC transporter substrate-binding protein, partial [Chloroflexota bacterium]
MKNRPAWLWLSLLTILSVILAACQPGSTPTPERIVETVVVTQMVQGTPVEIVVTPTPGSEETTPPEMSTAFLPADGMEACLPFPEGITLTVGANGPLFAGDFIVDTGTAAHTAKPSFDDVAREANQAYYGAPQASSSLQAGQGVYRIGVFEDITSLNFFAANGPDNTVWNSYMLPPRLAMYGLSEQLFNFTPLAAAVATPEPLREEGEFWVTEIPLRQDITWSDGEPFTAEDVAFSANTALRFNLIAGNWGNWYDGNFLDHVEAVDDYTVKYYYHTRPGMARHEYGTLQAPVLAAHYWTPIVDAAAAPLDALPEGASDDEIEPALQEATDTLFNHVPDGEPLAGAYFLERWEPGAFLDTSANPGYFLQGLTIEQFANGAYRDSEGVTVGQPEGETISVIETGPHAESVVYTIYGSQDAAILALRSGEVDFVLNSLGLQRGLAEQIRNDPNLTVIENPSNSFRYLSFNARRRPMNDCSFRQAVSALIDREFVTEVILQGAAFAKYSYIAEGNTNWYYSDVLNLGQGLGRQDRLALAIAILEQAGYTWENDEKPTFDVEGNSVIAGGGLIMPDGTPDPEHQIWAP